MAIQLTKPKELDRILRYPSGRSERLARKGELPHIVLPVGQIRFTSGDIESILETARRKARPVNERRSE